MSFKAKTIYVIVTSLFLVAFAFPLVGLTQKGNLQDLLVRVDERLSSLKSLSASFEQTREIKLTGETVRAKGRLYLRKPRELMLDYTEPERQKLLVRNSVVMIYLPSLNQVQRFDLGASGEEQNFFIFWEPLGSLEKRFTVGPSKQKDSRFRYVELVPKDAETGFKKLVIGIDTKLLVPRIIEVEEDGGDVVRMALSNVKVNPGLSQSLFELNAGKGVEMIDYSGKASGSPSSTMKSLQ